MDINSIIKQAKLGSCRKDAQIDCCSVFSAALFDALTSKGLKAKMVSAENKSKGWAHSLVEVDGRLYDSLGEFSNDIYRARAKVHHSVDIEILYRADYRDECFDPEFQEMYAFFSKEVKKSFEKITNQTQFS